MFLKSFSIEIYWKFFYYRNVFEIILLYTGNYFTIEMARTLFYNKNRWQFFIKLLKVLFRNELE